MMKKLTALLLAAALCLSLVGCAGKPELIGTYQTKVDLYDTVVEAFDDGLKVATPDFSLRNYLNDFTLTLTLVFNEDGTYSITVEKDSVADALSQLESAVLPLITDYLFTQFQKQFAPLGFTIETWEDVEAIVGMSRDEAFSKTLGKTAEQTIKDLINESFVATLTERFYTEGKFTAKDGKLSMSDSLDSKPSADSYRVYELGSGTVTVTEAVNIAHDLFLSYPCVLTQIEDFAES